jgi:hypothetical protein
VWPTGEHLNRKDNLQDYYAADMAKNNNATGLEMDVIMVLLEAVLVSLGIASASHQWTLLPQLEGWERLQRFLSESRRTPQFGWLPSYRRPEF